MDAEAYLGVVRGLIRSQKVDVSEISEVSL